MSLGEKRLHDDGSGNHPDHDYDRAEDGAGKRQQRGIECVA